MNGQGHKILIITLMEMIFDTLGKKLKIRHQQSTFFILLDTYSSEEERTFTFVQKIISRRGEMNF